MEVRPIDTLFNSPLNTFTEASPEAYEDLKAELDKGQHSTILITDEGEILGGKHRVQAMIEKGFKDAKCIVLSWAQSDLGYYAILDGDPVKKLREVEDGTPVLEISKYYKSVEELKMDYIMSHNHQTIHYVKDPLEEAIIAYPQADWDRFRVSLKSPGRVKPNLQEFLLDSDENDDNNGVREKQLREISCPECGHKFTI